MNTFIWSVIAEKLRPLKVRSISGLTCTLASTILLHSSRAQTKEKPSLPPLILVRTGIRTQQLIFLSLTLSVESIICFITGDQLVLF